MKTRSLRAAHALCAAALSAFTFTHLANHLAALGGVAAHTAFLHVARLVYRQPLVEVMLLASVAFQVATGLALVFRGRAVFAGRVLLKLDTDIRLAFLSVPIALGLGMAVFIPLCLGGVLIPVEIPAAYSAPFRSLPP